MPRRKSDTPPDAYASSLGLLSRREHSRRELERKLRARGVDKADAEAALDKLGEQSFQSDERFAAMLVRTRIAAGHGPQRIRAELGAQHGLPSAEIEAALAEEVDQAEVDWLDAARRQLQRRYGATPATDPKERNKRLQFLLRRGFAMDVARAACADAAADADSDLPDDPFEP